MKMVKKDKGDKLDTINVVCKEWFDRFIEEPEKHAWNPGECLTAFTMLATNLTRLAGKVSSFPHFSEGEKKSMARLSEELLGLLRDELKEAEKANNRNLL